MPIYDKPTKTLMLEFVKDALTSGNIFSRNDAVDWFSKNYPNIARGTVTLHVGGMAVNSRSRKHHPNIKPGSGHDLFFQVGPGKFRLWNPELDPSPIYGGDLRLGLAKNEDSEDEEEYDTDLEEPGQEFAYEQDLRNYLSKNLGSLEEGLVLFEEEGLKGVEYPVGGRYIDILAIDSEKNFVVIELKVSRGYDRTIGQILRYMAWVEKHMSDGKYVRGFIVAKDITEDLKLAASRISYISLVEYEIKFNLKRL